MFRKLRIYLLLYIILDINLIIYKYNVIFIENFGFRKLKS